MLYNLQHNAMESYFGFVGFLMIISTEIMKVHA